MYWQEIDERTFIKYGHGEFFFEILAVTPEKLTLGLFLPDPETKEKRMRATIEFEADGK